MRNRAERQMQPPNSLAMLAKKSWQVEILARKLLMSFLAADEASLLSVDPFSWQASSSTSFFPSFGVQVFGAECQSLPEPEFS